MPLGTIHTQELLSFTHTQHSWYIMNTSSEFDNTNFISFSNGTNSEVRFFTEITEFRRLTFRWLITQVLKPGFWLSVWLTVTDWPRALYINAPSTTLSSTSPPILYHQLHHRLHHLQSSIFFNYWFLPLISSSSIRTITIFHRSHN